MRLLSNQEMGWNKRKCKVCGVVIRRGTPTAMCGACVYKKTHPTPKPAVKTRRTLKEKRAFALTMKRNPTRAEDAMFRALLAAFKPYRATVRTQQLVGPYIADFLIVPSNVVVEVDGSIHRTASHEKYDRSRDTYMRNQGISVYRVTNEQVLQDPQAAANTILKACPDLLLKGTTDVIVTKCPPGSAIHGKPSKRRF